MRRIVLPMVYTRRGNLTGILFMLLGMLGFGLTDATAKWLVSTDYPIIQVIAIRGWFISLMLVTWVLVTRQISALKTSRPWGHSLRFLICFFAPLLMFRALRDMPLADVTVIVFGSTFMTTALSVFFFKEKVGIHRWSAVVLGMVGVVIALRPGTGVFTTAAVFALLAGLSFAGINLTTRWLRDTESALRQIFYLMLGITILSSALLPYFWIPVNSGDWIIFAGLGLFTILGYIFLTRAFIVAPTGLVAPFEYTRLLFATIIGVLVFSEIPTIWTLVGSTIIIGSTLYTIRRNAL